MLRAIPRREDSRAQNQADLKGHGGVHAVSSGGFPRDMAESTLKEIPDHRNTPIGIFDYVEKGHVAKQDPVGNRCG